MIRLYYKLQIYSILTLAVVIILFTFTQCDPPKEASETDRFETELQTFNNRMNNIGQSMEILDAMQNELDEVEKLRAEGRIDDAEFNTRSNEIKDTYGRAMARQKNTAPVSGLPQWARELGLSEPVGLILDQEFSQVTSANNADEGFNSVLLVYLGNYNTAMQEAQRIASAARVPLSKDFLEAKEITELYSSTPIKGVAYMNFDPFLKDAPINISITVDETGMLTISAVNVEQMSRQFERSRPTGN
ncbi:MAG: hypothetical protein Q7V19_15525 [Bacteroidales bacterium]|nr:hypothetical protein [Bacteroidales bacterium]MDP2236338.1 hypothetical protein [Bacteroidales bacterium]